MVVSLRGPEAVDRPVLEDVTRQRTEDVTKKQTPWPLVRKRTITTERPPLVDIS
jgi:hypothetical protein